MLTNSNLTECRKKTHIKVCCAVPMEFPCWKLPSQKKKWKHHIKMHFYDIILCWWNQLLTFKALFINNLGSFCNLRFAKTLGSFIRNPGSLKVVFVHLVNFCKKWTFEKKKKRRRTTWIIFLVSKPLSIEWSHRERYDDK